MKDLLKNGGVDDSFCKDGRDRNLGVGTVIEPAGTDGQLFGKRVRGVDHFCFGKFGVVLSGVFVVGKCGCGINEGGASDGQFVLSCTGTAE